MTTMTGGIRYGVCLGGNELEDRLFEAFSLGAARRGHTCTRIGQDSDLSEFDFVCMFGVKSKDLWYRTIAEGKIPIMFDKGYNRSKVGKISRYVRVSVGSHQPDVSKMRFKPNRIKTLPFPTIAPMRVTGKHILIVGSSAKCHDFLGIADPTEWARAVVDEIRRHSDRPIIYRPKGSWADAVPIPGTTLSHGVTPIETDIAKAWCLVMYSSGACVESVARGIPTLILGDAVAKPISSTDLADIERPECGDRRWLLSNVGYCQWTMTEIADGSMWNMLEIFP